LVKLADARYGSSHVDEYAAMAAVTFLASALTSVDPLFEPNEIEFSDRTNA
jgi:hypothetical protein